MYTIGVDLSSQPKRTGVCVIHWDDCGATVELVETGWDNPMIVAKAVALGFPSKAAIGIDSPFGWPVAFREFLDAAHPDPTKVPKLPPRDDSWRLRATDRHVKDMTGITPLAVAMDKIASVAVRCMYLQEQFGISDRCGNQFFYEVYPRASLKRWGFPKLAKGDDHTALLLDLALAVPKMTIAKKPWDCLCKNEHARDAFIAALTARAAFLGQTTSIDDALLGASVAVRQEGWIHLPLQGSLPKLVKPKAIV